MTAGKEPEQRKSKQVPSKKQKAEKKKQKQDNGRGTVFQRTGSKKWTVSFYDPLTGKRRSTTAASAADGRKKLDEMLTRAATGEVVLDTRETLNHYVAGWLKSKAGKRRKPATVGEYKWRLAKYVLPKLGREQFAKISVSQVEDLLDDLVAQGLSAQSIVGVRNALAAVYSDAAKSRDLKASINPARKATLPETEPSSKSAVPTTSQMRSLLRATDGTELGRVLLVLAGTGARIGEVLAAKWSDFDLEVGVWTVSATMTRDADLRVRPGSRTKTGEVRQVVLGDNTIQVLQQQRRECSRMKLASPCWIDDDVVFPSTIGTAQDARNLRKELRPIAKQVGFPGSFHQVRHYVASVALSQTSGNLSAVARLLGHSNTSTTSDVYGHLLDEDAVNISSALERHIAG